AYCLASIAGFTVTSVAFSLGGGNADFILRSASVLPPRLRLAWAKASALLGAVSVLALTSTTSSGGILSLKNLGLGGSKFTTTINTKCNVADTSKVMPKGSSDFKVLKTFTPRSEEHTSELQSR